MPSATESLFASDKSTAEIQKILRSRSKVLDSEDIEEVLISDLGSKGNFCLVQLVQESVEKFGGS